MSRLPPQSGQYWIGCEVCGAAYRSDTPEVHHDCLRCGAPLHFRKPGGIRVSLAWTLTALIMFVPANTLPMIYIGMLASPTGSTIIAGVFELLHEGMWPLALIVFVASFVVPLAKLAALIYLFCEYWRSPARPPRRQTQLYFITELIGRWSMVDIYVVAVLFALVQFGALASVRIGAGALSFALVVIATMFAAQTFDPRLLWDRYREHAS